MKFSVHVWEWKGDHVLRFGVVWVGLTKLHLGIPAELCNHSSLKTALLKPRLDFFLNVEQPLHFDTALDLNTPSRRSILTTATVRLVTGASPSAGHPSGAAPDIFARGWLEKKLA